MVFTEITEVSYNMTEENVKFVRDEVFRSFYKNKGIELRLDNNFIVQERSQFVIWDDDRNLIFTVQRNNDLPTQRSQPFKMMVQDFDQIQDMRSLLTVEELYTVCKAAGFTDDQIRNMQHQLSYSLEDYADSVSDHSGRDRSTNQL